MDKELDTIMDKELDIKTCELANNYYDNIEYPRMFQYCMPHYDIGCPKCTNLLGIYYYSIENNMNEALKYHQMALIILEKAQIESINKKILSDIYHNIGMIYEKLNNNTEMVKYLEKAIKVDNNIITIQILYKYYNTNKNFEQMIFYCKLAIEHPHDRLAMYTLGKYCDRLEEYDKSIIYLQMAVNEGCSKSFELLLDYYTYFTETDNIIQLLKLGAQKEIPEAMREFGNYYEKQGNNNEALKYHIMGAEKNDDICIDKINDYVATTYCLTTYKKTKPWIKNNTKHKLNIALATALKFKDEDIKSVVHEDECCICLDTDYMLTFGCDHSVCYKCYNKIDKCPLCRASIKN